MKMYKWEVCYDIEETSKILDEVILKQAEILRKNLREKRTKNNWVRELAYV
jgi:hypothetical protein